MADNERLLEAHLTQLDTSGASAPAQAASTPEMAAQIALVIALRSVTPPSAEVDAARQRVRARVLDTIAEEDQNAQSGSARAIVGRHASSTSATRNRMRGLASLAAVFLLALLGGFSLTGAVGAATPNSPLYGLKRADEWLALHTSWSDQRRGQVYATIAWRRLTEALYESKRHDDHATQRFAREYDDAMQRLIQLDAAMKARHENTTSVASGIARDLDRAQTIALAASQSGESTLAQTLTDTTAAEREALNRANIVLPTVGGYPTSPPTSNSAESGHGSGATATAEGQRTPATGLPTATSTHGTGSGNGNDNDGDGNGNGNGGHGGHAH